MNQISSFSALMLLSSVQLIATEKKPNIILILADDMSAKELSIYGNKEHKTPNIDQLAAEGTHFSTCWGAAVSSPARAMLLTGKYADQTGWYDVRSTPKGDEPNALLFKQNTLISKIAKLAGYTTAMSGKWQMGGGDPTNDWMWDEWSLPYKTLPWTVAVCPDSFVLAGQVPMYWGGPFGANGKPMKTTPQDFTEDLHNAFMMDFITRHKEVPFFYYWTTNLPHVSWDYEHRNPEDKSKDGKVWDWKYVEMPKRDVSGKQLYNPDGTKQKTAGTLKTNIEYLDYEVGKLVRKLKELEIYENTIIIFTADNATTGWKGSIVEEHGLRVPLIVRGPGIVRKKEPQPALVDFTDLIPTFAQIMGAQLPMTEKFDGTSFQPALKGEAFTGRDWIHTNHSRYSMFRLSNWILDGHNTLWYCAEKRDHNYEKTSYEKNESSKSAMKQFKLLSAKLPGMDTASVSYKRMKKYNENYKSVKEIENRTSHLDAP